MPAQPLDPYRALSPDAQQFLRDRVAVRLGNNPDLYPCETTRQAVALVRAELPRQLIYEQSFHRNDPLLPLPAGWDLRTCRCRAMVYADDATLSVLNAHTLTYHRCRSSQPPHLENNPRAEGFHHTQQGSMHRRRDQLRAAGRAALAETRPPQRIGMVHGDGS